MAPLTTAAARRYQCEEFAESILTTPFVPNDVSSSPSALAGTAMRLATAAQHQTVVRVRGIFISGSRGVAMTYGEARPPKHRAPAEGAPRPLIRAPARQGQTERPRRSFRPISRR